MSEFLAMGGSGPYVWSAYGITLGVLLWNVWTARAKLKRSLREAARSAEAAEPARRPTVSEIKE